MVSLWSQINSILLWWSESDVWSEGIRQLGAIVGQFRAALKRSFFFSDPDQFECFSHIRVKQSHRFPPVTLIQINTSVCSGVMQPASCRIGPPEEGDCRHKDDTVLQPPHCFLSPNRTNPEMNPNPVSRWSDLWKGSSKCLMVNKQHMNDPLCVSE